MVPDNTNCATISGSFIRTAATTTGGVCSHNGSNHVVGGVEGTNSSSLPCWIMKKTNNHHNNNNHNNNKDGFNCQNISNSNKSNNQNNIKAGHNCGLYYCSECERAVKKSRTLKLATGGDVILNSSIQNLWTMQATMDDSVTTTATTNTAPSHNNVVSGMGENNRPLTVRICMPSYDSRTHRVVISVKLEEKKSCKDDLSNIEKNLCQLKESGWFFEALTYQEAQNLLARTTPGTFLMRNSSDSRFLFSLSVQTERGPTSVRIRYSDGKFQLDTDEKFNGTLPKEESVIALIERHLESARNAGQVWVEPNGKMYSPVVLTKPLMKTVPSLRHMCRVTLNNARAASPSPKEPLPGLVPHGIKHYLSEYPYRI